MENINNLLSNSLDKYFNILRNTGYAASKDVDNLIILSGISYIIDNFPFYITEDNLRLLLEVLLCISGNCIIDYTNILSIDTLINNLYAIPTYRTSEDDVLRYSEDNKVQIDMTS